MFFLEVVVYHATLRVEFADLHAVVYTCFLHLLAMVLSFLEMDSNLKSGTMNSAMTTSVRVK